MTTTHSTTGSTSRPLRLWPGVAAARACASEAPLARNAAGVIFAHNHPSGVAEPSRADELLTSSVPADIKAFVESQKGQA